MMRFLRVAAVALLGVAGCAPAAPSNGGGPTTAPTIDLTPLPSWHPRSPGVRTGAVVGGNELYLYLWAGGDGDGPAYFESGWLDPSTGEVTDGPAAPATGGTSAAVGTSGFLAIYQAAFVGYPLLEWGALRGTPASIVVEADGRTSQATFSDCSCGQEITFFWLWRQGEPVPTNTPADCGQTMPGPEELYPLITAKAAGGAVLASARLRGPGGGQYCDG